MDVGKVVGDGVDAHAPGGGEAADILGRAAGEIDGDAGFGKGYVGVAVGVDDELEGVVAQEEGRGEATGGVGQAVSDFPFEEGGTIPPVLIAEQSFPFSVVKLEGSKLLGVGVCGLPGSFP
jgi:hypothetical protein